MKKSYLQIFTQEPSIDSNGALTEENTSNDAESIAENPDELLNREFEDLIKGKYASAFAKRTQGIIDKRFAKLKTMENTLNEFEPLLQFLQNTYPDIKADDTKLLVNTFLENAKHKDENTDKEEIDFNELNAKFADEADKLKDIYPSFSLEHEIDNSPQFLTLVNNGVPLRRAYETVNFDKILHHALRYAVISAGKKTADAIKNSKRVPENSFRDSASSIKRIDVNSLTNSEIMKIISDVSKGAKITFN